MSEPLDARGITGPLGKASVRSNSVLRRLSFQAPHLLVRRVMELESALRDLRDAATEAYKAGRIAAEPYVHAGNVLAGDNAEERGTTP